MKLDMTLEGPSGKMWDLTMNYHNLPLEYEMEVASVARALTSFIANMAGGGASNDKVYSVKFAFGGAGASPKGPKAPPEYENLFKGAAEAENLLYSQAVEIQDAGIALLTKLMDGAHMEIKSGQRS